MKKKMRVLNDSVKHCTALTLAVSFLFGAEFVNPDYTKAFTRQHVILKESFNDMTPGECPTDFHCYGDGGTIVVEDYMGNKCVDIKTLIDGKYTILKKNFDSITENTIEVSLDFMQQNVKSDGNVLLTLYDEDVEFVRLITNDGNICYETADGMKIIKNNYSTGEWYSLKIEANLIVGEAKVYVNGKLITEESFLCNASKCTAIGSYSMYSPGFYVDNLCIIEKTDVNKIVVVGPDTITIPEYGENDYTFSAIVYDNDGANVKDLNFEWSLENEIDGVEIVELNSAGTEIAVCVSERTTHGGIIKLKVVCKDDDSLTEYYYIALIEQEASSVTIEGPTRLKEGMSTEECTFKAVAKDEFGDAINKIDCLWYMEESAPDFVTIDSDSGVLYIDGVITQDTQVKIYAKPEGMDAVAEKTVILQTERNYNQDVWRMNVLKTAVDNVIKYAKNPYNDGPLLATSIDLRTMLPMEWRQSLELEPAAYSNLAEDSTLYMAFDILSELTGDTKYKEKVDEIYSWYLENGLSENMMGYWGGHTFINLKNMNKFMASPNPNTHEFKDTFFYFTPFYRLDKGKAYEICMNVWLGHVWNWDNLMTNRHAKYTKTHDPRIWEDLDAFPEIYEIQRTTSEQPFRSMACDLVHTASQMYTQCGDKKAVEWGLRILKCYYELADENTGIIPYVYTTARGAEGVLDPDLYVEPIGAWWTNPDLQTGDHVVTYGDRFFNQFALDLVAQNFYTENELAEGNDTISEMNFQRTSNGEYIINDLIFAETIKDEYPEYAEYISKHIIRHTASFINYAWEKGTDRFKFIMADGTDLSEFIPNRNGYYGNYYNVGKKMGTYKVNDMFIYGALEAYKTAVEYNWTDEAAVIKEIIDYFAENVYGFGKFGDESFGDDNMLLRYDTENASPLNIMLITDMYYYTGRQEFLDLARVIGENMIKNNFKHGIFVSQSGAGIEPGNYYNVLLGGQTSQYYYALEYLEGAIRGNKNLAPKTLTFNGYYQDMFVYENNNTRRIFDSDLYKLQVDKVLANDIVLNSDVLELSPGEIFKLEVEVLPFDATNKSVDFWIEDNDIVRMNNDSLEIRAVKKGETKIICVSSDLNVSKYINVIVR